MAFKGEIALGALNTKYKYGFTVGDIYRVQGAGTLVPNNYPAANGEFVEWTADGWRHSNEGYATLTNVSGAAADILDDHASVSETLTDTSRAFYDDHELGRYYAIGNEVWLCTGHTRSGSPGEYTYETELTKVHGVVPVINTLVNKLELEEITGVTFEINPRFTAAFEINSPKFYKYGNIIIVQNFNFIAKSTSAFTASSSDPWNIGDYSVCMAKIHGLDDLRANNVIHTLHKSGSSDYWFVTSFQKSTGLNSNIIATGVNQSFPAAASSWYGAINTILI